MKRNELFCKYTNGIFVLKWKMLVIRLIKFEKKSIRFIIKSVFRAWTGKEHNEKGKGEKSKKGKGRKKRTNDIFFA